MRAIVILISAAILGFFGYQYAANGNTPVAAISAVTGATAAAEVAAETGMADLLTADGFDADKVIEMISNSDLSAVQQTVLSGAVNAIKDNPALLEATLTRLKEALGQ
ncbi:MAG: hypothetical protein ACKVIA_11045 [Rhodobacterales bacterium]|jgi:hypothetical protein|tara:strand:+ start:551 stop:874 length:324 start_codon:yes stop_codon:yes gene_type:complete